MERLGCFLVLVNLTVFISLQCDVVEGFLPFSVCSNRLLQTPTSSKCTKNRSGQFLQLIEKSEAEWQEELDPEQFYVLRQQGTEPPNSSELNFVTQPGTFVCAACRIPLFTTQTKFDSGTGWPSFYAPVDQSAISLSTDFKLILPRTECSCSSCGGHLGHVFDDGPDPTGQRFCINGLSMTFKSDEEDPGLAALVAQQSKQNPYQLSLMQVLPSVMMNGILGGLFFNSFLLQLDEITGLPNSPLDALPLLPAIYFGVLAARSCGRLEK